MNTVVVWFRRDLRLSDNPALFNAAQRAERVIPLYIHAPDEEAPWSPGEASCWWLHHSLDALCQSLGKKGSELIIRKGPSLTALRAVVKEVGAEAVFWNRLYEPKLIARDKEIKSALRSAGVTAESYNSALLVEPWEILNKSGKAYKVFTAYWKALVEYAGIVEPLPEPSHLNFGSCKVKSLDLSSLGLLSRISWHQKFDNVWSVGEVPALIRLRKFLGDGVVRYIAERDIPSVAGTSNLSPHLHFGEIGPRQIRWEATKLSRRSRRAELKENAEAFIRELVWREFAHYVLYHFPYTADEPMDERFKRFPWHRDGEQLLRAWKSGSTGFPIVDAGMRELWGTGVMHNRVRMIVASLLTKNCRVSWVEGAKWFWDTLVDADLACNSLNWQWVAGSGVDAAPYFRIFNPIRQSERFDPEGVYIRKWVPELRELDNKSLHQPWTASRHVLKAADYPKPIVNLAVSRDSALAAYSRIVKSKT